MSTILLLFSSDSVRQADGVLLSFTMMSVHILNLLVFDAFEFLYFYFHPAMALGSALYT